MPRFISPRDYNTVLKINRELVNEVLDTPVVLFKMNTQTTQTNSYGEATNKHWYTPVEVPCRIEWEQPRPTDSVQLIDIEKKGKFHFLREELKLRDIYPEKGDFVFIGNQYYEINNTIETQWWGGQVEYNHSIVCEVHLSRKTNLQLDPPNV
jgi:hypothetical protein